MPTSELTAAVRCFCSTILARARSLDVRRLRIELLDEECMIVYSEAGERYAAPAQRWAGFAGAVSIDEDRIFLEDERERVEPESACEELQRRLSENLVWILDELGRAAHRPRR